MTITENNLLRFRNGREELLPDNLAAFEADGAIVQVTFDLGAGRIRKDCRSAEDGTRYWTMYLPTQPSCRISEDGYRLILPRAERRFDRRIAVVVEVASRYVVSHRNMSLDPSPSEITCFNEVGDQLWTTDPIYLEMDYTREAPDCVEVFPYGGVGKTLAIESGIVVSVWQAW